MSASRRTVLASLQDQQNLPLYTETHALRKPRLGKNVRHETMGQRVWPAMEGKDKRQDDTGNDGTSATGKAMRVDFEGRFPIVTDDTRIYVERDGQKIPFAKHARTPEEEKNDPMRKRARKDREILSNNLLRSHPIRHVKEPSKKFTLLAKDIVKVSNNVFDRPASEENSNSRNELSQICQEAFEKIMHECGHIVIRDEPDGRARIAYDDRRRIDRRTMLYGLDTLVKSGHNLVHRDTTSIHLKVHVWAMENLCDYISHLVLALDRYYDFPEIAELTGEDFYSTGVDLLRLRNLVCPFVGGDSLQSTMYDVMPFWGPLSEDGQRTIIVDDYDDEVDEEQEGSLTDLGGDEGDGGAEDGSSDVVVVA